MAGYDDNWLMLQELNDRYPGVLEVVLKLHESLTQDGYDSVAIFKALLRELKTQGSDVDIKAIFRKILAENPPKNQQPGE